MGAGRARDQPRRNEGLLEGEGAAWCWRAAWGWRALACGTGPGGAVGEGTSGAVMSPPVSGCLELRAAAAHQPAHRLLDTDSVCWAPVETDCWTEGSRPPSCLPSGAPVLPLCSPVSNGAPTFWTRTTEAGSHQIASYPSENVKATDHVT